MMQATAQATTTEAGRHAGDWARLGERIVECIRQRDFERLEECFHPQVQARLLIPPGLLKPLGAGELAGNIREWFAEADRFEMEQWRVSPVGDRLHIGYHIRLREAGCWYVVEQQAYAQIEEGAITRFDLLCSGFRPD